MYTITVTLGRVHDCLGMNINLTENVNTEFSMIGCIKNIVKGLPDDIKPKSATSSGEHLFVENKDNITNLMKMVSYVPPKHSP